MTKFLRKTLTATAVAAALAAGSAGAAETKLEGRIVPVVRTRMAGISRMARMEDKLRAWAQVSDINPEPLLACLAALEEAAPEDIAAKLLGEKAEESQPAEPMRLVA